MPVLPVHAAVADGKLTEDTALPAVPSRLPLLLVSAILIAVVPVTATAAASTSDATIPSVVKDRLLFYASDAVHGGGLWSTDGTDAGTRRLMTIAERPDFVHPMAHRDGALLFAARDAVRGSSLWSTDGTRRGTRMIKDLGPGARDAIVRESIAHQEGVLFSASDGERGRELWWTDGTRPGTRLLIDIQPGQAGSIPRSFTRLGERVVFIADDGIHGPEPWITDGTKEGTSLVRDILPGPEGSGAVGSGSSNTLGPVLSSRLVFSVKDGVHGRTIWTTDGTESGTIRSDRIHHSELVPYEACALATPAAGDLLLFPAPAESGLDGLWRTDGTDEGTSIVDASVGGFGAFCRFSATQDQMVGWEEVAYLTAHDADGATRLWRTDGTPEGTLPLGEFPGSTGLPRFAQFVNELVLFRGDDGVHGEELWVTDGTAAGTSLLKDIAPGGFEPHHATRGGR